MTSAHRDISVQQVNGHENMPYDLLLLADPSTEMIDAYLKQSKVFVATLGQEVIGTIVISALSAQCAEIKNIAVRSEFQGKGVGKRLLDFAIETARNANYQSLCIGTSNSSIAQLYLYQSKGFEIKEIIKDFFINNYPEPIYENGIRAKHMIMLEIKL
jgi:ribosomal protein S18 acetylase RimI-like enzyme